MITFEIKQHSEINEINQGINLTEFTFSSAAAIDNDEIVETFIHSTHFSVDSLRDIVKNDTENKPFLRCAFNTEKINVFDFKKQNKSEVKTSLFDFINQPDWGDDRNGFAKLLDSYFKIHNNLEENDFYIISKDWFAKGDDKVFEPEGWIYSYYFLIIYIDRQLDSLMLTEWSED